ncbi:hypothetical protein FIU97_14600 [Roseivivax sp. THAF40]|uniref:hypothetical protein n=1 Tax=Roseivivax sp. THAF40 TaxID=2587858 RepID=UPI00126813A7|nr:hypothetical protein [Roseivivax sp. THAF40]QFT47809.1 hypothetical protein FIU97_14600 [Roseivivax sp. THAF40]
MPNWPAGIPFFASREGYRRSGPSGTFLESQFSIGPPKRRPLSSIAPRIFQGRINNISLAQLATFEQFFEVDLVNGLHPFEASDPLNSVIRTYRFQVETPYRVAPQGLRVSVEADLVFYV